MALVKGGANGKVAVILGGGQLCQCLLICIFVLCYFNKNKLKKNKKQQQQQTPPTGNKKNKCVVLQRGDCVQYSSVLAGNCIGARVQDSSVLATNIFGVHVSITQVFSQFSSKCACPGLKCSGY